MPSSLGIASLCNWGVNTIKNYIPGSSGKVGAVAQAALRGYLAYAVAAKAKGGNIIAGISGFVGACDSATNAAKAVLAIKEKNGSHALWFGYKSTKAAANACANYYIAKNISDEHLGYSAAALAVAYPVVDHALGRLENLASRVLPKDKPLELLEKQVKKLIREKDQSKSGINIDAMSAELNKLRAENENLKADKLALSDANTKMKKDLKQHQDMQQAANRKGKAKAGEPARIDLEANQADIGKLEREISQKDANIKILESQIERLTTDKENLNKNAAQLRAQLNQLAEEEAKQNPNSDLVNKLRRLVKLCEELGPNVMSYYTQHASPSGAAAARARHR
jgi:predicted  nucleic acid-binding Zn-ribbon protein